MTKLFVTLPALALALILSGSAVADNGIDSTTLNEMGLAGITVMSDADAMAIRGFGYDGGHKSSKVASSSLAFGVSYAKIETKDGHKYKSGEEASAGTLDGFLAKGTYMAAGEHGSEAGYVRTETKILEVKGEPATLETHTKSFRIFAGGFATASSL